MIGEIPVGAVSPEPYRCGTVPRNFVPRQANACANPLGKYAGKIRLENTLGKYACHSTHSLVPFYHRVTRPGGPVVRAAGGCQLGNQGKPLGDLIAAFLSIVVLLGTQLHFRRAFA